MFKLSFFNLPVFFTFSLFLTVSCSPPAERHSNSTSLNETPPASLSTDSSKATKIVPHEMQSPPSAFVHKELRPADYLGRWLVLNVGEAWSDAFREEGASGIDGQGDLEAAGISVLHVYAGVEPLSGMASIPREWLEGMSARRSVPSRILINPKGEVMREWAGHVDGVEILRYISTLQKH